MDDELEDKVLYQTYLSSMKLMSKLTVALPPGLTTEINTLLAYFWRIVRTCALRPELVVFGAVVLMMIIYLQAVDMWSRCLFGKLQYTLGKTSSKFLVTKICNGEKICWELKQGYVAAYAVQGHRPHMEDRFVIDEDINNTGVSVFAVFDGHGGQFAADYARDKLMPSINKKVVELKNILAGQPPVRDTVAPKNLPENEVPETVDTKTPTNVHEKRKSFKKSNSTTDDCMRNKSVTDPELLDKLQSLSRPITREVKLSKKTVSPKQIDIMTYLEGEKINYARLLTDEVLAVDSLLVDTAKKNMDVAGTTALIAVLDDNKLIVANVGDSRGVMCDNKGNVIPLSFDHKPQQQRERQRINKAGGLVTFNGVWRVAGILATSRALGDYPLKDKKFVIADPDILTFDLSDHDPMFLILASDGLWDTFSNEEAVAFIRERLNEPYYGAKSLTLQSYYRGSLDNITVVVINLKDRKCSISELKRK